MSAPHEHTCDQEAAAPHDHGSCGCDHGDGSGWESRCLALSGVLVGAGLPMIFYFLELIVGFMQALVFAALTLVFTSQAVQSHVHDDEHGEDHH